VFLSVFLYRGFLSNGAAKERKIARHYTLIAHQRKELLQVG